MIYTVGYQGMQFPTFETILDELAIDILIDVRSKPHGRAYQYNRLALEKRLKEMKRLYWYKGDVLGGFKPVEPAALERLLSELSHKQDVGSA